MKQEKKKDAIAWRKIQAIKWADFAGSGCLKFGFAVMIRNTRRTPVYLLEWQYGLTYKATPCRANHIAIQTDSIGLIG